MNTLHTINIYKYNLHLSKNKSKKNKCKYQKNVNNNYALFTNQFIECTDIETFKYTSDYENDNLYLVCNHSCTEFPAYEISKIKKLKNIFIFDNFSCYDTAWHIIIDRNITLLNQINKIFLIEIPDRMFKPNHRFQTLKYYRNFVIYDNVLIDNSFSMFNGKVNYLTHPQEIDYDIYNNFNMILYSGCLKYNCRQLNKYCPFKNIYNNNVIINRKNINLFILLEKKYYPYGRTDNYDVMQKIFPKLFIDKNTIKIKQKEILPLIGNYGYKLFKLFKPKFNLNWLTNNFLINYKFSRKIIKIIYIMIYLYGEMNIRVINHIIYKIISQCISHNLTFNKKSFDKTFKTFVSVKSRILYK